MEQYTQLLMEKGGVVAVALVLTWTIGRLLWFVGRRLLDMLDEKDKQLTEVNAMRAEAAGETLAALKENNMQQDRIIRMLSELVERRSRNESD